MTTADGPHAPYRPVTFRSPLIVVFDGGLVVVFYKSVAVHL